MAVLRAAKSRDYAPVLYLAGALLLALGVVINWRAGRGRGEDFGFLYVLAKTVLSGQNIYLLPVKQTAFQTSMGMVPEAGMYYPPSSGIIVLPLTLLSYSAAKLVWFCLLTGVLAWGLWELIGAFAPRIGPAQRLLWLGALICCSSIRWGFLLLQSAPLALGLTGLFLAALLRNRETPALLLASVVVWLKLTLGLPLLAVALVQRRFRLVAVVLVIWGLVNIVGFARLGGLAAVQGYRSNLAQLEQPGGHDYADPRQPNALTRLDWPYLFNAISLNVARSRKIGQVLLLVSAFWLALEAWRCRGRERDVETVGAFLTPILCLSLLGVYHHHYDVSLLLAPLAVYGCGPTALRRLPGVFWFAAAVIPYACLYPVYQVQVFALRHFGAESLLYLKLTGCVVVSTAFAASLVALRHYVGRGIRS